MESHHRRFFRCLPPFFFPGLAPQVDFSRPFEFLDKELKRIYPKGERRLRRADQLAKVFLKNGSEVWLLVHVEVQGYTDDDFAKRMFTMFYRMWERFAVGIEQIAIFTDDSPSFHPKTYQYRSKGTWLNYGFRTWKLLDNPPDLYQGKKNIFAPVMEVAWHALKKNKLKDKPLLALKFSILKRLLEEGYPKDRIEGFMGFLTYYVQLDKPEFQLIFEDKVYQTRKKNGNPRTCKRA